MESLSVFGGWPFFPVYSISNVWSIGYGLILLRSLWQVSYVDIGAMSCYV
jgi:hypothetical protein